MIVMISITGLCYPRGLNSGLGDIRRLVLTEICNLADRSLGTLQPCTTGGKAGQKVLDDAG